MAVFPKDRRLSQVGREHLQACAKLVASTPELMQATAAAFRLLSPADIRRANSSPENAASLLNAGIEDFLSGSPPGEAVEYVFHMSIFAVASHAVADGPLAAMAGDSAASNLAFMLFIALEGEDYDFILAGAATDTLDQLGDILGRAYYNAEATGFRLAAMKKMHRTRTSAMDNLDIETQLEVHRMRMRELLPIARYECEADETRGRMLDVLEELL